MSHICLLCESACLLRNIKLVGCSDHRAPDSDRLQYVLPSNSNKTQTQCKIIPNEMEFSHCSFKRFRFIERFGQFIGIKCLKMLKGSNLTHSMRGVFSSSKIEKVFYRWQWRSLRNITFFC